MSFTNTAYLGAAYGRSYNDVASMVKDWETGKDFRIGSDGPYCSIRDVQYMKEQYGITRIVLTHGKLYHTISL